MKEKWWRKYAKKENFKGMNVWKKGQKEKKMNRRGGIEGEKEKKEDVKK